MLISAQRQRSRLQESCLLLAFGLIPLVSATCAPPPIPVRVGNVTLSNEEHQRGLDISVGSPQQHLAFLPQWPLNNSILFGSNGYCFDGLSEAACTTFRGGQYDKLSSSTRGVPDADSYPEDAEPYPPCDYITDDLTLSANVTVEDFPLGITQADWGEQAYFPQIALGLGPNSTVLSALKASGQIVSRTWSMFWGRTGATKDTQLEGNFVFGGYDRAKVRGAKYTRNLSYSRTACPTAMVVTISDIIINFKNGTDTSLFGGIQSAAITACIVPSYPILMTMPRDPYFEVFEDATDARFSERSFGINFYGVLYDTDYYEPFDGDMTFQIDSTISIRVPNDQLVVPDLSIDQKTGELLSNASSPELVINPLQDVGADDIPKLGRNFLTSAYVMLNQDSNEFTLWEANPTTETDLVAVDSENQVIEDFCATPSPTASSTASNIPSNTALPVDSTPSGAAAASSNKISGGAIAGIVVGCLAGLAILAGIIFWLMRRRSARPPQAVPEPVVLKSAGHELPGQPDMTPTSYKFSSAGPTPTTQASHELYSQHDTTYFTHELHSKPIPSNAPAHELPG